MNRIKRPVVALGAAALLAVSVTACGGGAPTDASVDEFCKVVDDNSWAEDLEPDDYEGFVEGVQEQSEAVEEVGTPEDIPDDAREGWQIAIDAANDLDADTVESMVKDGEDPISELDSADQEKHEAYQDYKNETCSDSEGSAPEEE